MLINISKLSVLCTVECLKIRPILQLYCENFFALHFLASFSKLPKEAPLKSANLLPAVKTFPQVTSQGRISFVCYTDCKNHDQISVLY